MGSMMFYVHAQMVVSLSKAKMFYCSMHIPNGLEVLGIPTDGCSVCMHIMFVYSKFW